MAEDNVHKSHGYAAACAARLTQGCGCMLHTATEKKTLIVSADTDVTFIGLPMQFPTNTILIKTNVAGKPSKYLHMHKLQDAIQRDPDLAGVPDTIRAQVLQAVYALSGCDFVSWIPSPLNPMDGNIPKQAWKLTGSLNTTSMQ